jgi:hypothetical protein
MAPAIVRATMTIVPPAIASANRKTGSVTL